MVTSGALTASLLGPSPVTPQSVFRPWVLADTATGMGKRISDTKARD